MNAKFSIEMDLHDANSCRGCAALSFESNPKRTEGWKCGDGYGISHRESRYAKHPVRYDDCKNRDARDLMRQWRLERLGASGQLTISTLLAKLEVCGGDLPVIFAGGEYCPDGLCSWSGVFSELSIQYSSTDTNYTGCMSVACFVKLLQNAIGQTFEGSKGGEFVMSEDTPVWVADYGHAEGFLANEDDDRQAVMGVKESRDRAAIVTDLIKF